MVDETPDNSEEKKVTALPTERGVPVKAKPKGSGAKGSFGTNVKVPAIAPKYTLDITRMRDTNMAFRSTCLFKEFHQLGDKFEPIFTLKDYHRETIPSFKRLYVDICDPTEYRVAMELFGSWAHWKHMTERKWFQETLQSCREEVATKLKSQAMEQIKKDSVGAFSEATRLAANKLLASLEAPNAPEEAFKKAPAKVGRPTKEEIGRKLEDMAKEGGTIDEDFARITVIPISGEKPN